MPLADVPASLGDGPSYDRPAARPADQDALVAADPWPALAERFPAGADLGPELLGLLSLPNIGDSSWVWRQYDHQLFLNTVAGPGGDAAVLRPPGHPTQALALSTDGKARFCRLDPRTGGPLAVLEAARNVACAGARPLALVNCLNFGNPEHPEVMWQFAEVVDGMADACRALGLPVVGGNVSFYNESEGADIHPTPVVGCRRPDRPARRSGSRRRRSPPAGDRRPRRHRRRTRRLRVGRRPPWSPRRDAAGRRPDAAGARLHGLVAALVDRAGRDRRPRLLRRRPGRGPGRDGHRRRLRVRRPAGGPPGRPGAGRRLLLGVGQPGRRGGRRGPGRRILGRAAAAGVPAGRDRQRRRRPAGVDRRLRRRPRRGPRRLAATPSVGPRRRRRPSVELGVIRGRRASRASRRSSGTSRSPSAVPRAMSGL